MREFEIKVGLRLPTMVERWLSTLPKVVGYMERLNLIEVPPGTSERKYSFKILMTFHRLHCDKFNFTNHAITLVIKMDPFSR